MPTTTCPNVELKNVKIHPDMSEETTCFSATVYVDGKKAGTVKNAGHGGCNDVWIQDRDVRQRVFDWIKTLPPRHGLNMDVDWFFTCLLTDWEETKQLKRWCRTKTVLKLKDHGENEYATFNVKYNPAVHKVQLEKKYGPDLVEIVNERFT